MTTERSERIPELTLGWRLKMALGDMKRDDMAEVLGVNPATISRWMADKGSPPKRAYLAQWAFATGVPVEWLEIGRGPSTPPEGPRPAGDGTTADLDQLTAQKAARARTSRSANNRRYAAAA